MSLKTPSASPDVAAGPSERTAASGPASRKLLHVPHGGLILVLVLVGRLAATVANSALTIGRTAVKSTVGLLDDNEGVDKISDIPLVLVTKDNLSEAPQYCPK
ncbi:hypothetical protein STENM223S_11833 [Streptomyces tendae]